ncbi:MAG: bifunctional phosphoglucose/phosphomannose isomerase [Patescibacteria group bacterium]
MPSSNNDFDKENMAEVINQLPDQFIQAFNETKIQISSDTKKIIFCGMGGSALPANLLKTFLSVSKADFNISIKINRDYTLPDQVDDSWCGIFSSYSGNTEETLSALSEAEKRGLKQVVVMAHSGKLKQFAEEKGYLLIEVPDTLQPRLSYGYMIGAMLKLFSNSGLLNLNLEEITKDVEACSALNSKLEEQGKSLAESIKGKIPIVYASNVWKYLAMVWKINFNENAKTQSFWNCFPELNHNEMVGYTNLVAHYKIIILKDPSDHERIQKRIDTFKQILGDKIDIEIVPMIGETPFTKMLSTLLVGQWTSYHLALLYKLDPAPVDLVEEFKKKI